MLRKELPQSLLSGGFVLLKKVGLRRRKSGVISRRNIYMNVKVKVILQRTFHSSRYLKSVRIQNAFYIQREI
jgi:hypothetical protein